MNAYAMFLADDALRMAHAHEDELRDEATIERLGTATRRARGIRGLGWIFRSARSSIRNAANAADAWSATIPRLADYPYRG